MQVIDNAVYEFNAKGPATQWSELETPEFVTGFQVVKEFEDQGETRTRLRIEGKPLSCKKWIFDTFGVKARPSNGEEKAYAGKVSLQEYLGHVFEVLKMGPYLSKSNATKRSTAEAPVLPTCHLAWERLRREPKEPISEDCQERARRCVYWGRQFLDPKKDEFTEKMYLVLSKDDLSDLDIGVASWCCEAWGKYNQEEALSDSEWQGQPGAKLEDFRAKVLMVKTGECTKGPWMLLKFFDEYGNVFTWFPKIDPGVVKDDVVVVSGATVQSHDQYEGKKQTMLSWCQMSKETKNE